VLVIVLVSGVLSGQQPKRKREPYMAPLLPAEQAWKVTLPAPPAADAVMDDHAVYVPLESTSRAGEDGATLSSPAAVIALARETGATLWTTRVESHQPLVLTHGVIVVAATREMQALDPSTGQLQWSIPLDRPVREPMTARGALLLAMLEGDELLAVDVERRDVAWRRSVGESGPLFLATDDAAAYVVTVAGRVSRHLLSDGSTQWERPLAGELSAPTVDGGHLLVGSNANLGSLWCLDVRTGKDKWVWPGRVFGGAVLGVAVQGDRIYVTSKDNIVRVLNRKDGVQRWKQAIARPAYAPHALTGVVTVVGLSPPSLATFRADTGAAVSTWTGPQEALWQGAPLIENPKALSVSIVALFRDGQIVGMRSTEMMLREPALVPITVLPGRALGREALPADPASH
jgi:outer membrane protein assembly factor BamB